MHLIPVFLFSLLLVVVVIIILDEYGIAYFKPSVFKRGILFYKKIIYSETSFPFVPYDNEVLSKEEGVFFFHPDGKIYFRSKRYAAKINRFHSVGFLATGEITDDKTIEVTARFPLGVFLMIICFALVFSLGSFLMGTMAVFIGSILFFGGLLLITSSIDRSRMNKMCEELKVIMSTSKSTT